MAKRIYCNPGCREAYREDRRAGLIYGAVWYKDDAGVVVGYKNHFPASVDAGVCPYDGAPVVKYRRSERFPMQRATMSESA